MRQHACSVCASTQTTIVTARRNFQALWIFTVECITCSNTDQLSIDADSLLSLLKEELDSVPPYLTPYLT